MFGGMGTAQFHGVQQKHVMLLSQEPVGGVSQLWEAKNLTHSNPIH